MKWEKIGIGLNAIYRYKDEYGNKATIEYHKKDRWAYSWVKNNYSSYHIPFTADVRNLKKIALEILNNKDFINFTIAKQAIKNDIKLNVCQIINNQAELESNFNKTIRSKLL
jgi:hypothetical protein